MSTPPWALHEIAALRHQERLVRAELQNAHLRPAGHGERGRQVRGLSSLFELMRLVSVRGAAPP